MYRELGVSTAYFCNLNSRYWVKPLYATQDEREIGEKNLDIDRLGGYRKNGKSISPLGYSKVVLEVKKDLNKCCLRSPQD
jgi:hypothetical protein